MMLDFLNSNDLNGIANNIKELSFEANQALITCNALLTSIYIIKEGEILVLNTVGAVIRRLGKGDLFGESDILYGKASQSLLKTNTKVKVYEISKENLLTSIGDKYVYYILFSIYKNSIQNNSFFMSLLIESDIESIYHLFKVVKYERNDIIYSKKNANRLKIVIVLEGSIVESKLMSIIASKGALYGDVLMNLPLENDLIAFPHCICLETSWELILKEIKAKTKLERSKSNKSDNGALCKSGTINSIHNPPQDIGFVTLHKQLNILKKTLLFKGVSESKLISVLSMLKKETYHLGTTIITEGSLSDKFYLILKGKVVVKSKDGIFLRCLEDGSYFGELGLLERSNRTASVIAETNKVVCYVLSKEDFEVVVEGELREQLIRRKGLIDPLVKFEDLVFIKHLGKGKFGSVSLVHYKKFLYAIKSISKVEASSEIASKYIQSERKILLTIDHPFIIKLVRTFKDSHNFYYLLEYVEGVTLTMLIDLKSQIKKNEIIPSNISDSQFYCASIILALEYLNKRGIIHRDLKPDNIMISKNGYLKLIDFGGSKIIKDYTDTIVGTPHYMAPEVVSGKGYNFMADYWSLGVLLYQLIYHKFPFSSNCIDIITVYKNILTTKPKYYNMHHDSFEDNSSVSIEDVNSLLQLLLEKDTTKRSKAVKNIKIHRFFNGFDFVSIKTLK